MEIKEEIKEEICVNNYLPYYPVNHYTLGDSLLRNKYEKICKNKKEYFENAKIVNFDLINNECRGDSLKNSVEHYQTIKKEDLKLLRKDDERDFVASAIRTPRNDVKVARDVATEHFKNTVDLVKFRKKNKILFSSMYGKKRKKEYDLARELYSHLKIK